MSAVARAVAVLDAVASGRATDVGTVVAATELPRSSVIDVVDALIVEGLLQSTGHRAALTLGPSIASFGDSGRHITRLKRLVADAPQLTGVTVAVVQLVGSRALVVDVRGGTQPLPRTPRPGQWRPAGEDAGAVALVRSDPARAAAVATAWSGFEGGVVEVDQLSKFGRRTRADVAGCVRLRDPGGALQIGQAVNASNDLALVAHVRGPGNRANAVSAAIAGCCAEYRSSSTASFGRP